MGRFRGVLLATDYDDTLYSTNATISPENRQAIEYFVAEGGQVLHLHRPVLHQLRHPDGEGAAAGERPGDPLQRRLHL